MGARVARMFRNFNLESRVNRELSKGKPQLAPRHPGRMPSTAPSSGALDSVTQKNTVLLDHLRSVYVESTDSAGAAAQVSKEATVSNDVGRRPIKVSVPGNLYGLLELTDVPKGKLTITEALKALSSHRQQPQIWTSEKIAEAYSLDLEDTKSLLEFFIPFKVEVISSETEKAKQIKDS
ncbi:NADH dehydrogenase [ubiquinone] 1 alpha subcomplex assembly factor 4 [Pholidichthys leucotaenia]